jgi:hypothetical protein
MQLSFNKYQSLVEQAPIMSWAHILNPRVLVLSPMEFAMSA